MESIKNLLSRPDVQPLLDAVTELRFNAIPKEYQEKFDDEAYYWDVVVTNHGKPDAWSVSHRGKVYDINLESEHEPQPSSRSDSFLLRFRFNLSDALDIAERVAPIVKTNGLTAEGFVSFNKEYL